MLLVKGVGFSPGSRTDGVMGFLILFNTSSKLLYISFNLKFLLIRLSPENLPLMFHTCLGWFPTYLSGLSVRPY